MDINITEAAKVFGVSRQTIYAMQKRGELPDPITAIDVMKYIDGKEKDLRAIKERLGAFLQLTIEAV